MTIFDFGRICVPELSSHYLNVTDTLSERSANVIVTSYNDIITLLKVSILVPRHQNMLTEMLA